MFDTSAIHFLGHSHDVDTLAGVLRDYVVPVESAGNALDWTLAVTGWNIAEPLTLAGVDVPVGIYLMLTVGKTESLNAVADMDTLRYVMTQVREAYAPTAERLGL